jgi:ribosome-associated protein
MKGVILLNAKERSLWCASLALDKKATNIVILEVKERSSFTDYFIICSGNSDRQVKGIASTIEMGFKKKGIHAMGMEGFREGQWILLDYDDIIVHIFHEPLRAFYDLERLWADVPRVPLDDVSEI